MLEKLFSQLRDQESRLSGFKFDEIFGDMGDHNWKKFTKGDNSLVRFWSLSDSETRQKLIAYLETQIEL